MYLIFKVGNKYPIGDPRHYSGWRDGQLVDVRPDSYVPGFMELKHFVFLKVPGDYWDIRKSNDWKATNPEALELKKLLTVADASGRYPWDKGYIEPAKQPRKRDGFIDFAGLLSSRKVDSKTFSAFYDNNVEVDPVVINTEYSALLQKETDSPRIPTAYSNQKGSIATGTYAIGAGLAYATIQTFEADIAATLTGDLTAEHNDEETAISTGITFDVDTSTYKLTLTAQSGDEHDGGAYGNGARITYGTYDFFKLNGASLNDIEVSKLAFDISGAANYGWLIDAVDGALFHKLLFKGGVNSYNGIYQNANNSGTNVEIRNNIFYGIGEASREGAIVLRAGVRSSAVFDCLNNTIINCYNGILQYDNFGGSSAGLTFKNNLVQASRSAGFVDENSTGWGTTSKNISEDASSPDVDYRSKDLHTNSVFQGYATNDYRLDSAGDASNLAIVDDGDDLSASFTDDIQGQTRSTWYIGASEIVSAAPAGLSIPVAMYHYIHHNQ